MFIRIAMSPPLYYKTCLPAHRLVSGDFLSGTLSAGSIIRLAHFH
jgi:hypothetical protein